LLRGGVLSLSLFVLDKSNCQQERDILRFLKFPFKGENFRDQEHWERFRRVLTRENFEPFGDLLVVLSRLPLSKSTSLDLMFYDDFVL
jgi:hypothetical protein